MALRGIALEDSRGATLHALYALRSRTVLVFEDAYAKHHQVLPAVDKALHTLHAGWATPFVVFFESGWQAGSGPGAF